MFVWRGLRFAAATVLAVRSGWYILNIGAVVHIDPIYLMNTKRPVHESLSLPVGGMHSITVSHSLYSKWGSGRFCIPSYQYDRSIFYHSGAAIDVIVSG